MSSLKIKYKRIEIEISVDLIRPALAQALRKAEKRRLLILLFIQNLM